MSRTVVDVHEYTHTCADDPRPHIWDTRHVVSRTPGGPCLAPVTIAAGPRRVQLPCHRVRRVDQQCDACRPVVVVRNTTVTFTGAYQRATTPAPTGRAEHPCDICGQPLAAVLAGVGRHILCVPGRVTA